MIDRTEVRFVTSTGAATHLVGQDFQFGSADGVASSASFHEPQGIAVDPGGHLAIADTQNYTIRRVTNRDVVTTLSGAVNTAGTADGDCVLARFNHPQGLAYDAAGNLYIADTDNNSIRKITFTPQCVVSTIVR